MQLLNSYGDETTKQLLSSYQAAEWKHSDAVRSACTFRSWYSLVFEECEATNVLGQWICLDMYLFFSLYKLV